jgi:hypothetical protein
MVKSRKYLHLLYSKMVHVTCPTYGFHRVAEEVHVQLGTIDKIVTNVKKKC